MLIVFLLSKSNTGYYSNENVSCTIAVFMGGAGETTLTKNPGKMNRTTSFTPSTTYVKLENGGETVDDMKLSPSVYLADVSSESSPCVNANQVRVYRRRWLALAVFCLHLWVDNIYWVAFSPISIIASCYYGVGIFWINSLSWVFFVTLIIFFIPTMWFLKRFGLRVTAVIGGCALTAGGWLRFAGTGTYTGK